jgi:hypothetical protein
MPTFGENFVNGVKSLLWLNNLQWSFDLLFGSMVKQVDANAGNTDQQYFVKCVTWSSLQRK